MFSKDIVAWGLLEEGRHVQEVHVLKDGGFWLGPQVSKARWKIGQRLMFKPYPANLRQPIEVIQTMVRG